MSATTVRAPLVVASRADLAAARSGLAGRVAVVMTMGALHDGHAALMREARAAADSVIVTIFVNPLQFGANEDLDRYPRTFDADLAVCAAEGVDLVFAPTPDVVYPEDPIVRVSAGVMGESYEGAVRPGHFDGVLTVVCKLLNLTRPDVAFFGAKDAQQLALIRRMVRDLDLPVEVIGIPTVRESDGMALSSRNVYLSSDERRAALAISHALRAGAAAQDSGAEAVVAAASAILTAEAGLDVDYLDLVDPDDFAPVRAGQTCSALLIAAARAGATRLIDNSEITLPEGKS